MKRKVLKYISRIDSGSTHGYFVRTYKDGKVLAPKLFSDLKMGGKRKALRAAKEYRAKVRRRFRLPAVAA
jgi:hypothetical protein